MIYLANEEISLTRCFHCCLQLAAVQRVRTHGGWYESNCLAQEHMLQTLWGRARAELLHQQTLLMLARWPKQD